MAPVFLESGRIPVFYYNNAKATFVPIFFRKNSKKICAILNQIYPEYSLV